MPSDPGHDHEAESGGTAHLLGFQFPSTGGGALSFDTGATLVALKDGHYVSFIAPRWPRNIAGPGRLGL